MIENEGYETGYGWWLKMMIKHVDADYYITEDEYLKKEIEYSAEEQFEALEEFYENEGMSVEYSDEDIPF